MRRTPVLLALVWLLGVAAAPADAHVCTAPVSVSVGSPATVNVAVTVEEYPVDAVDITVPSGFKVTATPGHLGWTGTVSHGVVHFVGDPMTVRFQDGSVHHLRHFLSNFTCGYLTIQGTATSPGKYVFPITTHDLKGVEHEYANSDPYNPLAAQIVYAGHTPASRTSGSSVNVGAVVLAALAAIVVVAGTQLLLRRRNAPSV